MMFMIDIEAKVYIQTSDTYSGPYRDGPFILVKSDGPHSSISKLVIDNKEYRVYTDELVMALQRCSRP